MAMVVLRAAKVLDLTLPTVETKQTILTEVLQPSHQGVEPLLPFNDTLTDIVRCLDEALHRGAGHMSHFTPSSTCPWGPRVFDKTSDSGVWLCRLQRHV